MTENASPGGGPAVAATITVALIPQAAVDLQRSMGRENLSGTDVANRAISLYEFASAHLAAGGDLLLRDAKGNHYLVEIEGTGKVAVTAEEGTGAPEGARRGNVKPARDA